MRRARRPLQARADLESARTNASLAEITAKRWQSPLGSDAVSKQDVDQRTSDYAARRAAGDSALANVNRLVALKGFARLVAPFDGVVTARRTDVGALVNAGGSTGEELFTVSDVTRLRVYVQVPQNYAPSVRPGTDATLTVPEYPQRKFVAKVVAASGAVNPQSDTTLVQLVVDNRDGALLPGAFANPAFALPASADTLRVPASSILFDAQGTRVMTMGADGHIHYRRLKITRDLGTQVEIADGIGAGERIVDTPPDGLADGDAVRIATGGNAGNGGNADGGAHRARYFFSAPNFFWSVGPSIAQYLFDGGLRRAQLDAVEAATDEAAARYRGVALAAFQQVEDSLTLLHDLGTALDQERESADAAQRAVELALTCYQRGIASYLDVVQAQTTALSTERSVLDIQTRQLVANMQLVRALGGGWSDGDLDDLSKPEAAPAVATAAPPKAG